MLHPLAVFSFLFLLFLLDFDKVLNDGEDTPATEEVYHHFTPSPFQTNLKEEDYKPIVKKPVEVPENPVDPSRYAGHSLMKRILEAEKEQQQQQQQDKKENDECEECCEKILSPFMIHIFIL